jgi:hypothetical protein
MLKEEFIDQDKVSVRVSKCQVVSELGLDALLQGEGVVAASVAHEMQKRQAERNRNVVNFPESERKIVRMYLLDNATHKSLQEKMIKLSKQRNVTTTGLAIAVFGNWAASGAKPEDGNYNGVDDPNMRDLVINAVKHLIDYIEGHLRPKSDSRNHTDNVGLRGESSLMNALKEAGVERADYQSQQQQQQRQLAAAQPTPDVLFHAEKVILGRRVRWIECKKKLLIPGLSTAGEVNAYDNQIRRYTESFGPGAVFWGEKGFCAPIQSRHENVAHFTQ